MNGPRHEKRILIVDDIPENIRILGNLLKSEYRISLAISGEKALKKAVGDPPPDLILLDIMMPGIDGFEVCERLKRVEKTKDIPIIFITAKNAREDEEKGFLLGAADYIKKPYSTEVVKAKIKMHMKIMALKNELEQEKQIRKTLERSLEKPTLGLVRLEKELENAREKLRFAHEMPDRRGMKP